MQDYTYIIYGLLLNTQMQVDYLLLNEVLSGGGTYLIDKTAETRYM
jgi:hypothetical protein